MEITLALAAYAAALQWEALPETVQRKTRDSLLDALACAAAGEATAAYRAFTVALEQTGDAGGASARAHALGFAMHVLEYDDSHKTSKTHPGSVVIPAVLETARVSGASSAAQLAGIVAGYEVMLRLGVAVGAAAHRRAGWHATSTTGAVGAAVGAARTLGLDADRTAQAIGHAMGQMGGTWSFMVDASATKPLQVGNAARVGLLAAFAAAEGVPGVTHALETSDGGFFALFGGDPAAAIRDLPTFLILDVATKPYPCCRTVQAGIDAVLALRPFEGPMHVKTFAICVEQNGFYAAGNGPRSPFSLPLILAAAARDGRVDFETFSARNVASLRAAERSVTWEIDPALDAMYPEVWPAEVDAGGRVQRVLYALGDPKAPMDEAAYAHKLAICAGANATALRERVDALVAGARSPAFAAP